MTVPAAWSPGARADSGLVFHAHRRDALGRHISKYGAHEPELTHFIAQSVASSPPGIFVDAGANFGWHALHAARLANIEQVVAFEPDPFNAWLLDRNKAENAIENVVLVVAALGARCGTLRLNRYKESNLGRHSATADFSLGSSIVPLVDLDSALDSLGMGGKPVAVLKIDVEGYEPAVIEGAKRTLARTHAVVTEVQPALHGAAGLSVDGMLGRLGAEGFVPHVLSGNGTPVRVDIAAHLKQHDCCDVIWLRRMAAG
jgi:FkbM family methyltransferase